MATSIIELIPVHNEADHLATTMQWLIQNSPLPIVKIVLCENGSTDSSRKICEDLCRENSIFTCVSIPEGDLGLALREGLKHLAQDKSVANSWIHINGADVPFGLTDLRNFSSVADNNVDLVLGSKFVKGSTAQRGLARKIASFFFFLLRFLVLGLPYHDTQGTLFFRGENMSELATNLRSKGFITTTEVVLWFHRRGKRIKEVPVELRAEMRPSSVKVVKQSIRMFKALIGLRMRA